MAIVGFSFTKILAEKRGPIKGRVSIKNNVSILGVEDAGFSMAKEKKGLRIKFAFDSTYEPEIGVIRFEGEVLLLEEAKVAASILERWAKEKALPAQMVAPILNQVLDRSNIQALVTARELNLPSPIQLPRVTLKKGVTGKEEKKKGAKEGKKEGKK